MPLLLSFSVCRLALSATPYEINPISRFSSPYLSIRVFLFSLKLECEKLANEKTEMQRHYVMVSRVNYRFGLHD